MSKTNIDELAELPLAELDERIQLAAGRVEQRIERAQAEERDLSDREADLCGDDRNELSAHLGQQLAAQTKPDSPYREWVMTYSSPQFDALARRVEGLLDRYRGDHDRLAVLYHQAMELELRFFDAADRWERP